ncbi:MAG: hypothetical protein J6Y82_00490 [Bacteroidales bacterium]|nr:hypothetical protein [Bacteroidales bacterium]
MNNEEHLNICLTCQNRQIDLDRGLVCSLTNAKPHFEGECMGYAVDEQVMNEPEPEDTPKRKDSVSGWLAFFLYVAVGLATAYSVYTLLRLSASWSRLSSKVIVVMLVLALLQSIVAIATIRAFHRRLPDAVAWARTYLWCLLIGCILDFCVVKMTEQWLFISDYLITLGPVLGPIIWLLYLKYSRRVRTVIPPEMRTWRPIQKQVMVLWIAALFQFAYIRVNQLTYSDPYARYRDMPVEEALLEIEEEVEANGGICKRGRDIVSVEFLLDRLAPDDSVKQRIDYMLSLQIQTNTPEIEALANVITKSGYRLKVKYVNHQGEVLGEYEYGDYDGRPPMQSPTDEDSGK